MKTQKKYLASANTSIGFKNCFDSINTQRNSFCYILKGGPGTGKSSLMKKVANYFENKGHDVEYFYCSSDADSLDGIRIKNISIVDGTAPHVTEASMPGIKERIINVGEFIRDDIKVHKTKIENLMKKKSLCFKLAYKYFSALKTIVDIETCEFDANKKEQKKLSADTQLNTSRDATELKPRQLFASYISPNGFKSFYKQNNYNHVILLNGNFIEEKENFEEIENKLKTQNTPYTKFLSVFDCNLTEGILNTRTQTLYVCRDAFEQNPKFKNAHISNFIIKKVAKLLERAKFYHKKIESFYVPCMDFENLSLLTENIIEQISEKI